MNKSIFQKTCMVLAVMAVIAIGTGHAAAEPREEGPRGPDETAVEEKHHQWLEKLNLSAYQKDKIDKIHEEQRGKMKSAAEQLRAEHEKMREMMQGDATDDQLREQHAKVAALRAAAGEARFETFLKIRAVLNRGQRKRMGAMHHEGMGHSGHDMKDDGK